MILVYYRLYITYTLAAFLFDLDQSNVCRNIQKIESLIRKCVLIHQKIYSLTKRLKILEEVERCFPGFMAFIDCTKQPILRPIDNRIRKTCYSGKKERHTEKTQLLVNDQGIIIHKLRHKVGQKHDYDIYKKNHPSFQKRLLMYLTLDILV